MISRLPYQGTQNRTDPSVLRTVLLACAEEPGVPSGCTSLLRRHAVVLRTHGGQVPFHPEGPLGALLDSQPVERLIVLGHTHCAARGADLEPASSTAAIGAWCRYAPAAHELAGSFAAGALGETELAAQLDVLVRMANVEACPQAHAALREDQLELVGLVWDAARGQLQRFDGRRFVPIDKAEFRRLVMGGVFTEREPHGHGEPSMPAVATPSQPPPGEITGGMA